jgi:hypothetical protein
MLAAVRAAGAEVEIISPREGAELTGKVEVVARVVAPKGQRLDRAVVQGQTGEQIRLAPRGPDIYSAVLDTTRLPNGRQALLVTMATRGADARRFRPEDTAWGSQIRNFTAEVRVVVRNPYRLYWGDLHAHTSYSDGCRVPKEAYEYARDQAKIDFFAVTDHSQLLTFDEYADVIAQAERYNQPGRFVTLYGAESTESTGHFCFYMSPTPRLSSRLDDSYQEVGRMGLLAHFNHPNLSSDPKQGWKDDFQGFHYVPAADRSMAMVEVRSPTEEAAYIAMLNAGWHVGAAGCEDKHDATWGKGDTWTVALARQLSRDSILEALWARRTYSAADRNLELTFTVDGEDMGAQVARPAGALSCVVAVADPDDGDAINRIELFLDGRIVGTVQPKLKKYAWSATLTLSPGRHYAFVRVTQTGDRMSWSSPVWVSAH